MYFVFFLLKLLYIRLFISFLYPYLVFKFYLFEFYDFREDKYNSISDAIGADARLWSTIKIFISKFGNLNYNFLFTYIFYIIILHTFYTMIDYS